MRSQRRLVDLLVATGLLLQLASPAPAQEGERSEPTFEETECPFEGARSGRVGEVTCGRVTVQESRDRADSRTLRLAVVVLKSRSAEPEPDPVVYVQGGPGDAAIARRGWRRNPLIRKIREQRHYVLVDPRGVGYSEPSFCPDEARVLATVRLRNLPRDEELEALAEAANRCREKMVEAGTDLSAFNSVAMARDLDDVRKALGYREWNLHAVSYGTRVALTALRETPTGIRSVVLDGPVPPNLDRWSAQIESFGRALERVFQRCSEDPACDERFPQLDRTLSATLEELRREPLIAPVPERAGYPEGRLAVTVELFRSGIHTALLREGLIRLLPMAIEQVGARNPAVISAMAGQFRLDPDEHNEAVTQVVLCYEEYPFVRTDLIERAETRYPELAGWIALDRRRAICDALQPHRSSDEANSAVRSGVPALLLTGELDPVTPPSNGWLAAETLENAFLVEIPHRSHGNSGSTECVRGIVLEFFEEPRERPQTGCVSETPPLRFVTDMR